MMDSSRHLDSHQSGDSSTLSQVEAALKSTQIHNKSQEESDNEATKVFFFNLRYDNNDMDK